MSFFNTLRRKPTPLEEDTGQPFDRNFGSIRRRAKTLWSRSPASQRRQSVPQADVYQSPEPQSLNHEELSFEPKESSDGQDPDIRSRGRSPFWSKTSPFSSLRKRSRSLSQSRTTSPTRKIAHRAAELVRSRSSLFHRASPVEDLPKSILQQPSPSKCLQTKKSVHFCSEGNGFEIARSPPRPIPTRFLPSLPPLHTASSDSLNIGDTNTSISTRKRSAMPLSEIQNIETANTHSADAVAELPATPVNAAAVPKQIQRELSDAGKNPFRQSSPVLDEALTETAYAAHIAHLNSKAFGDSTFGVKSLPAFSDDNELSSTSADDSSEVSIATDSSTTLIQTTTDQVPPEDESSELNAVQIVKSAGHAPEIFTLPIRLKYPSALNETKICPKVDFELERSTRDSLSRSTSQSPSRKRFRFENRVQTHSNSQSNTSQDLGLAESHFDARDSVPAPRTPSPADIPLPLSPSSEQSVEETALGPRSGNRVKYFLGRRPGHFIGINTSDASSIATRNTSWTSHDGSTIDSATTSDLSSTDSASDPRLYH